MSSRSGGHIVNITVGMHMANPWLTNRKVWLDLVAGIAVLVLVVAAMHLYFAGYTLVRGADAADTLASQFYDISSSIREYGLWSGMYSPGLLAGLPHWSNPHFHPLYPFYFNWLGSDTNIIDTVSRINLVDQLHLAILGCGCYFLSRQLGATRPLAFIVGFACPWLPVVQSMSWWPQILASLAWMPWIFAFQGRIYAMKSWRSAWSDVFGLTVAATLLIYAQPAQNLVITIVGSIIVWATMAGVLLASGDGARKRRFIISTGLLVVAGLGVLILAGGYLWNLAVFHSQSVRWLGGMSGYVTGNEGIPVQALQLHALRVDEVVSLFSYDAKFTKAIGNAYVGGAVFVLAVVFLFIRHADLFLRALIVCAMFALLFCFSFMAPIVVHIPLVNLVREVVWWSCLAAPILLPVAAAGVENIVLGNESRFVDRLRDWRLLVGVITTAIVAAVIVVSPDIDNRLPVTIASILGMLGVLAALLLPKGNSRRALFVGALALGMAVPLLHYQRTPGGQSVMYLPNRIEGRTEMLALSRQLKDRGNYRIEVDLSVPGHDILGHIAMIRGMRTIRGHNMSPMNYEKFRLLYFPKPAVANLYGIKYRLVAKAKAQDGDQRVGKDMYLQIKEKALPRLFLVTQGVELSSDPVGSLLSAGGDAPRFFVAPTDLPEYISASRHGISGGIPNILVPHMLLNNPVRLRATIDAPSPGLLVLNEDPAGRWQLQVNGVTARGFRINGFQTAFVVPSGALDIDIERPGGFWSYRWN